MSEGLTLPNDSSEESSNFQRRTKLWQLAIFAVILAFVALLAIGLQRQSLSGKRATGVAPAFSFTTFEGQPIQLSDLRGKGVVVNFWASWCVPCRNEAAILEQTWQREKDNGIVVIGLDYLDQDHKAKAFLQEFGVTYPNGADLQSSAARRYGIEAVPETFFINPEGVITDMKIGEFTSQQEMDTFLEKVRPN